MSGFVRKIHSAMRKARSTPVYRPNEGELLAYEQVII
jgi:hypothetical protein